MDKNCFITITGTDLCYGVNPFEVNRVFKLVKEPENKLDREAIRAELPYIGKIGYVANSTEAVAKGTFSAGRILDLFKEEALAQVLFVSGNTVIALIVQSDKENGGTSINNHPVAANSGEIIQSKAEYEVSSTSGF